MDYSKRGYLLARENESKINSIVLNKNYSLNFENYTLNESFENISSKTISIPKFSIKSGNIVMFYCNFTINTVTNCNLNTKIKSLIFVGLSQTKSVLSGESQVSLLGKVEVKNNMGLDFELQIDCDSPITVKDIQIGLLGEGLEFATYSSRYNFDVAFSQNSNMFYYINNNNLYICEKLQNFESLNINEFEYLTTASRASICFDKQNLPYLFRVDSLGNLYMSTLSAPSDFTFIASMVSSVSTATLVTDEGDFLVCFLQNGLPKFCVIDANTKTVSAIKTITLKYPATDIIAVPTSGDKNFIVVCTKKGNFIFVNIEENFESISACCMSVSVNYETSSGSV